MNRRNFIKSTITAIALTASGLRLASAGFKLPEQEPQVFTGSIGGAGWCGFQVMIIDGNHSMPVIGMAEAEGWK